MRHHRREPDVQFRRNAVAGLRCEDGPSSIGRAVYVNQLIKSIGEAQKPAAPGSYVNPDTARVSVPDGSHAKRIWMFTRVLATVPIVRAPSSWVTAFSDVLEKCSNAELDALLAGPLFDEPDSLALRLLHALPEQTARGEGAGALLGPGGAGRKVLSQLEEALRHAHGKRHAEASLVAAKAPVRVAVATLRDSVQRADRGAAFSALGALVRSVDVLLRQASKRIPNVELLGACGVAVAEFMSTFIGRDVAGRLATLSDGELGTLSTYYRQARPEIQHGLSASAAIKTEVQRRLDPAKRSLADRLAPLFADLATAEVPEVDTIRDLERAVEAMEAVLLQMNLLGLDVGADDKARLLDEVGARLALQFASALEKDDAPSTLRRIDALAALFSTLYAGASALVVDDFGRMLLVYPDLAGYILQGLRPLVPYSDDHPSSEVILEPDAGRRYAEAIGRQFGMAFDWTPDGADHIRPWIDEPACERLANAYRNAIDTSPLSPWYTEDLTGEPLTLQLNRQFEKDAVDRSSVSISVNGVSDDGRIIHYTPPPRTAHQPDKTQGSGIGEDLRQLHAMAGGPGLTYLTSIMNQQLAAPLIRFLTTEKVIHGTDGSPVLVGGGATFHFDVSRVAGPGSDFIVRATIRMPDIAFAAPIDGVHREPLALDGRQSYLRANIVLRVNMYDRSVELEAPPRVQYNLEAAQVKR
jgi:hypothetical protein